MANFTFRGFKHNMKIQPVNINNNYSFQARKKEIKKADDIVRNVNLQFPALSTSYAKRYWHITNDKFKTSYKQKLLGFYEKINNCREKIQRNEKEDKLSIKVFENVKKYKIANCGEKCHLTFDDSVFGPDFEPLMELIYKRNYSPIIICESAGTQAKDALIMKKYYNTLIKP